MIPVNLGGEHLAALDSIGKVIHLHSVIMEDNGKYEEPYYHSKQKRSTDLVIK